MQTKRKTKSATEMFEDLGYEKTDDTMFVKKDEEDMLANKIFIIIDDNNYSYKKEGDCYNPAWITEAEHKAICKKIEELKNEKV